MNNSDRSDKLISESKSTGKEKSIVLGRSFRDWTGNHYFPNSVQPGDLLWPLLPPSQTSMFHWKAKMFTLIHHISQFPSSMPHYFLCWLSTINSYIASATCLAYILPPKAEKNTANDEFNKLSSLQMLRTGTPKPDSISSFHKQSASLQVLLQNRSWDQLQSINWNLKLLALLFTGKYCCTCLLVLKTHPTMAGTCGNNWAA